MKQLILMALLFSITCYALDYDVDSPRSDKPGYEKTCITIRDCETCVYVKKGEDFEEWSNLIQNEKKSNYKETLRSQFVRRAFDRYENGCK